MDRWFVGPDNGLLSFAKTGTVFHLARGNDFPEPVSQTFHGRDLFAPAASILAYGSRRCLGDPASLKVINPLVFVEKAEKTTSEVFHVDHFGNLITGVSNQLGHQVCVTLGHHRIDQTVTAFANGGTGPSLVPGSRGLLEIAVRDGRASDVLGAYIQQPIEVNSI